MASVTQRYDTIIVGAGAAGLYAALHAGRRGRRVLMLEHNSEPGAKILISGGGRCNFTNVDAGDPARYLSFNPHFARSALTRHTPQDFTTLVKKHNISFYEKTLGQLFCEGARSSGKIVRMLLDECASAGVEIKTNWRVNAVRRTERFVVETMLGAYESETLVIATGGLSIPKLGASGFAFDIARQFGAPIIETSPGLVPLTFTASDLAWMSALSGVSTDIIARVGKMAFQEAALFTHRGLSGPSILQASSYWHASESVFIDWLPGAEGDVLARRKRERPKAQLKTVLAEVLPERLAMALVQHAPLPLEESVRGGGEGAIFAMGSARPPAAHASLARLRRSDASASSSQDATRSNASPVSPPPSSVPLLEGGVNSALGDFKDTTLIDIARKLKAWPLTPIGTEGYAKAEVMVGGIDTNALSQQTMECRAVPGLFFIGECVDVTGWLGGYNFQWAWSSGWAAGQAI